MLMVSLCVLLVLELVLWPVVFDSTYRVSSET